MRSWKRLVTWREGDREVRRIVDAIEDAKRKWIAQGKKRRDLLEGRLLKEGRRSPGSMSKSAEVPTSLLRFAKFSALIDNNDTRV